MANQELHRYPSTKPRFFYGYIVVAAAFLIMVVSWGTYTTFGIFFKPLSSEFGWTRAVTSGAFAISTIVQGILGIIMGSFNDRFGPRVVVTICGFLLGLGYLLISQVGTLWHLYLFYGLIVGVGMSGIWVPLLSSVARWFVKRRGFMMGIVITGIGVGGFVAPPVISRLISAYDWRLSYIMLGSVILLSSVLAAQFLRRDPAKMGQLPYGEEEGGRLWVGSEPDGFSLVEAVGTKQFWIFFVMIFCFGFCMFGVRVHIVPHATDLEISAAGAANILAISGATGILGNFMLGSLGDRIGNRKVFIIGFIVMALTLFWLLLAKEFWMLYFFAIVFGFTFGMGAVETPLISDLFGLSSLGLIFGAVSCGYTIGAAVGPIMAGYIFDSTNSYQLAFLLSAAFAVIGLILALILRPTKKLGVKI